MYQVKSEKLCWKEGGLSNVKHYCLTWRSQPLGRVSKEARRWRGCHDHSRLYGEWCNGSTKGRALSPSSILGSPSGGVLLESSEIREMIGRITPEDRAYQSGQLRGRMPCKLVRSKARRPFLAGCVRNPLEAAATFGGHLPFESASCL